MGKGFAVGIFTANRGKSRQTAAGYDGLLQYSKSWQIAAIQRIAAERAIVPNRGKLPDFTADYSRTASWQIAAVQHIIEYRCSIAECCRTAKRSKSRQIVTVYGALLQ
jgi:hypothetical protein